MIYYLAAFLSGMSVMIVELSASRLIAPYFGTSLFVWTNVIGLVMFALALGYFFGGRLADRRPEPKLYFHLILGAGFWILFIPFVALFWLPDFITSFGNFAIAITLGSFLAILILLFVPMFFLGMVVPFTVKLLTHKLKEIGEISGRVSMVSTMGSLLGTFLPAFVLIPWLGTFKAFLLAGSLLVLFGVFMIQKKSLGVAMIVGLVLLWSVQIPSAEGIVYDDESPYGRIFISEHGDELRLHVDHALGTQSVYDPEHLLTHHYYSSFMALPTFVEEAESVLILGHAGGSFTRLLNEFYPDLKVTGVELDPAVTAAAETMFQLGDLDVSIVHADARAYLQMTEEKYDLIFVDAYHDSKIPPHLATKEFYELLEGHVTENGLVGVNIAAKPGELLAGLNNTFVHVFEEAYAFSVPDTYNTIMFSRAPRQSDVPLDLKPYVEPVWNSQKLSPDPGQYLFIDDKSALIELVGESMWLDLVSDYTF